MKQDILNIKDILNNFKSDRAKCIVIYKLIKNDMLTDKSFFDFLILFFSKSKYYYLAGETCKMLSNCFLDIVKNQQEHIKDGTGRDNTTIFNLKMGKLKTLEKDYSDILSKTINLYEKILLYDFSGNFLTKHAASLYDRAKYHNEQAKMYLNKSVFEQARHSQHSSSYYIQKSKKHENESNDFHLKSLKVYEQAIKTYKKSLNPENTLKTIKLYRKHFAEFIEKTKGIKRSISFLKNNGWYDLASEYSKKNNQAAIADKYFKIHQEKLDKYKKDGMHYEMLGKLAEHDSKTCNKKSKKFEEKALKYSSQKQPFDNLIYRLLKIGLLILARRYKKKSSKLFNNSMNLFQKSKYYYTQAEMLGKISELQGKTLSIPKEYAQTITECELCLIEGNSMNIYEKNKQLKDFIKLCKKENYNNYIPSLKKQQKCLENIIKNISAADQLEIEAEETSNESKKEKYYYKAMLLYEDAGCFQTASEVALKIEMNELSKCYKMITELN